MDSLFNIDRLIQVFFTLSGVLLIYNGLQNLFEKFTKTPSKPTASRRRLGKHEAFMNMLSEKRQGSPEVCLIISLKSKTKLVKEYVHKALVLLAKRQPMLRAIITTSGDKEKYFEIIDGDEITGMIDFTTSCDAKARQWQDVWHEVASKQRETRLLWKAVMLQEEFLSETKCYTNTLIFNFNHSAMDGVSSMKFCQQFLHCLNGIADGSLTSDEDVSSLSLSPSYTELLTREKQWPLWQFLASCLGIPRISKLILKIVIHYLQSRKQRNPFFVQFPPNPNQPASPRSEALFKIFSETETSNIVKACRLNGCTVTGALMAASHLAFCELVQEGGYSCKDVMQLEHMFAINSQRDCQPKPPKEYIGHFAVVQPVSIPYTDPDKSDFWKVAQESTKRIRNELKEEKYTKDLAALLGCFSTEELVNQYSPLDRQELIWSPLCSGVSSAGSFDFREEQKRHTYTLDECFFNSRVHGLTLPFIHFNTTVNGKMSWAVLYDPSTVNVAQAQRFENLCFDYFVQISE